MGRYHKPTLYKNKKSFTIYYNDDALEQGLKKLDDENIFFSGFFRFVLENEDILDYIIEKVPYTKSYRKGEQ